MFSSLISQAYLIINESEALHERRQLISASIVAAAGAGIRSQVKLHEYVCLQGLMCKTIHPWYPGKRPVPLSWLNLLCCSPSTWPYALIGQGGSLPASHFIFVLSFVSGYIESFDREESHLLAICHICGYSGDYLWDVIKQSYKYHMLKGTPVNVWLCAMWKGLLCSIWPYLDAPGVWTEPMKNCFWHDERVNKQHYYLE